MCRKSRIQNFLGYNLFQTIAKLALLLLLCGWSSYGGDLANTKCKNFSFNCSKLEVAWEFKPEEHIFRYSPYTNIWSTPVTANIDGRMLIYAGFYDNNLYCINLNNGEELWRFTTGGKVISSPVVFKRNGKYLVSFASRDRKIYCLDAKTGRRIWVYEVYPWTYSIQEGVPSSGIYIPEFDTLYFTMYVCDKKPFKTVERAVLVALSPQGKVRWKKTMENAAILSAPCYTYFSNQHFLFISSGDGNLYALSAEDGKLIWKFKVSDTTYVAPSILKLKDKIIIYAGDKFGFLYALDEKGGLLWKFKTGHFIDTSVAILNDKNPKVYLTSFDRKLYCLDALTGEKIFEFEAENYLYSSPLICKIKDENCVIFSSLANNLFVLNAQSATLIQKIKLGKRILPYETYGETIWPSPILTQNSGKTYLIYPSTEGSLFCLGCDS